MWLVLVLDEADRTDRAPWVAIGTTTLAFAAGLTAAIFEQPRRFGVLALR